MSSPKLFLLHWKLPPHITSLLCWKVLYLVACVEILQNMCFQNQNFVSPHEKISADAHEIRITIHYFYFSLYNFAGNDVQTFLTLQFVR